MRISKKVFGTIIAMTMIVSGFSVSVNMAKAANTTPVTYSYQNYNSFGHTEWKGKENTTKVYVNPQSGSRLYYQVGGTKTYNGSSNSCSGKYVISKGTRAGITNNVIESGCVYARLRLETIVAGNTTTMGKWAPDSTSYDVSFGG